jgi:hypothetical protein
MSNQTQTEKLLVIPLEWKEGETSLLRDAEFSLSVKELLDKLERAGVDPIRAKLLNERRISFLRELSLAVFTFTDNKDQSRIDYENYAVYKKC